MCIFLIHVANNDVQQVRVNTDYLGNTVTVYSQWSCHCVQHCHWVVRTIQRVFH